MNAERAIKYLWFFVVMKLTWILPDWVPIMWLRGFLTRPSFKKCGNNLQLSSDVKINCSNKMVVGNDVYIAHGCWLNAQGGIELADEVMLGPYTIIASGNHTIEKGSYRYGRQARAPVRIGYGSWTGAGTKILPGVTIGRSACCASGSVVDHDVEQCTVVGGVPARVIRKIETECEDPFEHGPEA